ncbi:hypothetical protein MBLNU230_g0628t1 [Neophaeotheca triangularis]
MTSRKQANGLATNKTNSTTTEKTPEPAKTDLTRWRLRIDNGRQTWHYLTTQSEVASWPQTTADKFHLGLPTNLPTYPSPQNAHEASKTGLAFFSNLQLSEGNWACCYGGPMFLLPGLLITLHVTGMPLSLPERTEMMRYLFNKQNVGGKNGGDGGWGLHIEGESSVFGTAMNYVSLRLLGVAADHPRMVVGRRCLHHLGGATNGPHWMKFWFAVLGVVDWKIVNPVPPELWLLPDWVPFHPWRWWIHMRMVYLPMGFIWSQEWVYPKAETDSVVRELREEVFVQPYQGIRWADHRNDISDRDNYHPKTWVLNLINFLLVWVWIPFFRGTGLVCKAESFVWHLIQNEDENSDYADLAPVNAPMNTLCCYIATGAGSPSVMKHRETLQDFLWMGDEGMNMNGTNGVQTWDTAFAIQAIVDAGLATKPEYHSTLLKALQFLESQQILDHPVGYETSPAYSDPPTAKTSAHAGYRHPRRGAWPFSTKQQGYTVSDCTSEALKSVLLLQTLPDPSNPSRKLFPTLVSDQRIRWAVDIILTMQNPNGACSSYEPTRGSPLLEYLNAAEVFGNIMIEYDYPECTTACVTTLNLYRRHHPSYRSSEITNFIDKAVDYIRAAQRGDGSWYGAWGICFTYASMFALESLKSRGREYGNDEAVRKACEFFLAKQGEDGGWGESYRSCETGVWHGHPEGSQVVQTAWVIIALLDAKFPHKEPLERAVRLLMQRQQANGEWLQEGIEGVFNKSCMISYPNYKFIFPIKALGMYARRFGEVEV